MGDTGTKRFVYLIRSLQQSRPYVGLTSDVDARLVAHNAGQNRSTAPFKPWQLVVALQFVDEGTATALSDT